MALNDPPHRPVSITSHQFGRTGAGEQVDRYHLTGAGGAEMDIITFGARIQSLSVPDHAGNLADVILGYDNLEQYEGDEAYHGAVVGRTAGRIDHGRFRLDGQEFRVPTNNGEHSIHGGRRGFSLRVWEVVETANEAEHVGVTLSYFSPDGEEGYPGNLKTVVSYLLDSSNELSIEYQVTTDRATPVILTQHAYFNLSGHGSGSVLDHQLTLDADRITPIQDDFIPSGSFMPVAGTAFDFRTSRRVGDRIDAGDEQLRIAQGYDHYFVLNRPGSLETPAARLSDSRSGRQLEVFTTEPGIQLYTSNLLAVGKGKGGAQYRPRAGLCLEAQRFPDAPNHRTFPPATVRPQAPYISRTSLRFSAEAPRSME